MGGGLALRKGKILLRGILRRSQRACGIIGGGGLEGEEALEDTLGLPLSGVREVNPYVHAPGTAESRVQALDVICGREQEPGNNIRILFRPWGHVQFED